MKELKLYYSIILLLLLSHMSVRAQENRIEIALIDTIPYTSFNTAHIPNARYPVTNLFDGKLNTCWVSRLEDRFSNASVYIALPNNVTELPTMTIYAGYWKSEKLYKENARPKKLKITAYYGIVADGFVSESGYMSFAHKLPDEMIIDLEDTIIAQSFELTNLNIPFEYFDTLESRFSNEMAMPILTTVKFIEVEVLEAYQGSRYSDVCISEIYFNDCFNVNNSKSPTSISKVYLNGAENTLLANTRSDSALVIYHDKDAVLQLIETSPDRLWAIVISMPAKVDGRVETTYELIDLVAGESVTSDLMAQFKELETGLEMYFVEEKRQLYLGQKRFDREIKVTLREIH